MTAMESATLQPGSTASRTLKFEKDGALTVGRRAWEPERTLVPDGRGGWTKEPRAAAFGLLEAVSGVGEANPWLTRRWERAKTDLR